MNEPVLQAEKLRKSYRMGASRLEVLRGVSLQLRAGEICALMGASGSGKSTLLNLLGMLDRPDGGKLWIAGREVQRYGQAAAARLRASGIGFVFQQFQLLPELNALNNVLMPRRLVGGSWLRRRSSEIQTARAALDRVGLGHRHGHKPNQLSGGEQQRVAIARALVSQPRLLLADEPTGNLDRKTSEEVLDLLLRLGREQGAAVMLATHDSNIAQRCDRMLWMRDGLLEPAPTHT